MSKKEHFLSEIKESVETLDFIGLRQSIKNAIENGISPRNIIKKGILNGIEHSGEIGLIIAAEALRKELIELVELEKEDFKEKPHKFSGKVVIGTVMGDIHDLGKNILVSLLKSTGIDVIDLGVDVSPEKIVACAKSPDVKVVALSSLLSIADVNVKRTIEIIEKKGLRSKLKIIIGGGGTTRELAEKLKADAYAKDAIKGFEIIEKWISNH